MVSYDQYQPFKIRAFRDRESGCFKYEVPDSLIPDANFHDPSSLRQYTPPKAIGTHTYILDNEITRDIETNGVDTLGKTFTHSFSMESADLFFRRTMLSSILEMPKQMIVGGVTGLLLGASCEYAGKYLGEGIGYLAGGEKGAKFGQQVGENIGAVAGMVVPYMIFI